MILNSIVRSAAALLLVLGPVAADHATLDPMIARYADKYGVSYSEMYKTIECESGFDPTIQSLHKDPTGPNGREDSWGLVQIHLPDHPSVTRAEATDPDFALDFMAKSFAAGHASMWSCYTKIYG